MIWLNLRKLEKQLINGEVSDKTAFSYLLTHTILITVAMKLVGNDDPAWAIWLHLLINVSATIWGMKKTYEINQRGDNREYLKRFLSLSFVVGIQMILLSVGLGIFLGMAALIAKSHYTFFLTTSAEVAMETGLLLILMAYYYYNLLSAFKRINAAETSAAQAETV